MVGLVGLEAVALVEDNGGLKDVRGFKSHARESEFFCAGEGVIEQTAAMALAAHGLVEIHLAKLARGFGNGIEAGRAEDLSGRGHKNIEHAASVNIGGFDVAEIGIRFVVTRQTEFTEDAEDEAFDSRSILIARGAQFHHF